MRLSILGVIQALKNLGIFFASYSVADIKTDLASFLFALLIFACISIPSDLYLLNKAHEPTKKKPEDTT